MVESERMEVGGDKRRNKKYLIIGSSGDHVDVSVLSSLWRGPH